MNKILLKVYQNIYEKSDGSGIEGYYAIKYNDTWVCSDKLSPTNKIPIAAQFKSDLASIVALLKTITGANVELEFCTWDKTSVKDKTPKYNN